MSAATRIFLADLAHTYSVSDRSLPMPLSIGYIKAYADHAHGKDVDIRLFKHPERFLAALHAERSEIVGFANYGWNQNLNLQIGRHVRRVLPGALIVAGGPNLDPEPARRIAFLERHDYLDFLVVDGGEESFSELISWHRAGSRDFSALPSNLAWREGGALRTTAERPLKKIIEHLPSPYLSGALDEFLAAGMIPMFETNRGCPFQCTFCAWGSASKDLVRRIDLDQSLEEIRYVGARSAARNWIVCDANFGILPRDIELAKAIRAVRDARGVPEKCHVWLAKNVTDRNLVIGEILGDMTVPVMAVQSLDDDVLKHIKRDNISIDTYEQYQRKFHRIGSRTYSDLIVPLPGETLESHLAALRILMNLGVDVIANHNMRLLAGAETNSQETRERFRFRTRYRLIHGDAGIYRAPDGTEIRVFEYEESLRATELISEDQLFYLRKLHFLVDYCWNIEVYKPLLKLGALYGVNPVDVLVRLLEGVASGAHPELTEFFAEFDRRSQDEWFDSERDILDYFAQERNFRRLLDQEFEKLNIQFSVIALRDYKAAFDAVIGAVIRSFDTVPADALEDAAELTFALFPGLSGGQAAGRIEVAENLLTLDSRNARGFRRSNERRPIELAETRTRKELQRLISTAQGTTLSKILNTQSFSLRDLRLQAGDGLPIERMFEQAT